MVLFVHSKKFLLTMEGYVHICICYMHTIVTHMQVPVINQAAFLKAFEEFRYCTVEKLKVGKVPLLECPACKGQQHSVHIDGNRKLYRFSKVPR